MLTEYKPFEFVQKFYIEETEGGIVLHYIDGAITYSIHIENDAYIPKSGLALCSWLAEICCGKSQVDSPVISHGAHAPTPGHTAVQSPWRSGIRHPE